jgi:hypothetical protein
MRDPAGRGFERIEVGARRQKAEVRKHLFEDDGRTPNNPELPLLLCPRALGASERSASRCKDLLAQNGWGVAWVDGVFSFWFKPDPWYKTGQA